MKLLQVAVNYFTLHVQVPPFVVTNVVFLEYKHNCLTLWRTCSLHQLKLH